VISEGEAVSKNSVSASIKLVRASSIDVPSLAISSSGHRATNPSSSRSMIAVTRYAAFMIRVYTGSIGCSSRRSVDWQLFAVPGVGTREERAFPGKVDFAPSYQE
jgi:hypothetical protein